MKCNIMNHVLRQEKQATAQLVLAASDTGSHDHCAEPPSLNASICTLTHFSDTYQLISRSAYCKISPLFANPRSSIVVIVQGWPQQYSDIDIHTRLTVNSSLKDFLKKVKLAETN